MPLPYRARRLGTGQRPEAERVGIELGWIYNHQTLGDHRLTTSTYFQDRYYLTAMFRVDWRQWNMVLSYTDRTANPATGSDIKDKLFQASVGYNFGCNILMKNGCLSFDTSYRFAEEENIESHAWGGFLVYSFNFAHAFK